MNIDAVVMQHVFIIVCPEYYCTQENPNKEK